MKRRIAYKIFRTISFYHYLAQSLKLREIVLEDGSSITEKDINELASDLNMDKKSFKKRLEKEIPFYSNEQVRASMQLVNKDTYRHIKQGLKPKRNVRQYYKPPKEHQEIRNAFQSITDELKTYQMV